MPPPVPPPVPRMRLLKLRAPTMPPAAIPIRAPPGPRSFSERASPRPRRQGRVAKARAGKAASPRPRHHRPSTAASPPVRRMRLLKLRAPTMPPEAIPIRAPPGPRSFSERASPRPRRQGRVATARPPPAPPPMPPPAEPPVRRMRLLKLRAPTMPPEAIPIRAPPGPRSFSERAWPRCVGKARRQGRVAPARPPPVPRPCHRPRRRPSPACAC
jgi:hypothetical protein